MNMHMKVEACADITSEERESIESAMSREMGEHIMRIGKTDFAEWSHDEWKELVSIAFELAALRVFTHRIRITRPFVDFSKDEVPF